MGAVWWSVGPLSIPVHSIFVGLGVLAAALVLAFEARRRRMFDEDLLIIMTGALIGGAIGMRAGGFVSGVHPEGLTHLWVDGAKSILGGLTGAYVGVLIAKRATGYTRPTGDLFAPAVALGMAIGRIGCLLTEPPGRPTSLPWAVHMSPQLAAQYPDCAPCQLGVGLHPSFAYEIGFQLVMFVVLIRLSRRALPAGALFTLYLAAYACFRFLVEFTRANDTMAFGLTRSQIYLLSIATLVALARLVMRRYAAANPRHASAMSA